MYFCDLLVINQGRCFNMGGRGRGKKQCSFSIQNYMYYFGHLKCLIQKISIRFHFSALPVNTTNIT